MKNMFSRKQLGIPYGLFLVLFVAAPLLVLVYYAFTDGSGKFSITNLLNFSQTLIRLEHCVTALFLQ